MNGNDTNIATLKTQIVTLKATAKTNKTLIKTLETAAKDNKTRIAALEATITNINSAISVNENAITTNESDISTINNNSVLELDGKLSLKTVNNYATAQFSGVNVQVINGTAQTTANGLGNLIVGYNNPTNGGLTIFQCSIGTYVTRQTCESNGYIWSLNHKTGSHNLIAGDRNSYSQTGGVVFGYNNRTTNIYATVTGGSRNSATGQLSSISGGQSNATNGADAGGAYGSVSGGSNNIATGIYSSVSGGQSHTATGYHDWRAGSLFENN